MKARETYSAVVISFDPEKRHGIIGGVVDKIHDIAPDKSAEITSFNMTVRANMPMLGVDMSARKSMTVKAILDDGTSIMMHDLNVYRTGDHVVTAEGTAYVQRNVKRHWSDP